MKRLKTNLRRVAAVLMMTAASSAATFAQSDLENRVAADVNWSLRRCIEYAISHNTSIQQQELSVENSRIRLETTRFSRLPDLSANIGESLGFGRSQGRDGSTVDNTSSNTHFGINASMPLFTGFRIPNQIKADEYTLKMATENLEKARRDISIRVATYYLNALYYRGLAEIQQQQLELSKEALRNATSLVDAGKKAESERVSAEAQVAVNEHSLTEAQGNARMAILDLFQALNIEDLQLGQFTITDLDTTTLVGDIPLPSAVFDEAVRTHPTILAAQYDLKTSEHQVKIARSYMLPSISLSGSYGNNVFHNFDGGNKSIGKQLKLNGSESLSLGVSIPIFSRFSSRNNVRQSRLQVQQKSIALHEASLSLRKEIEQAYWNAAKSHDNYISAQKAVESTRLAYRYEADRQALGRSTVYDLQQASTRLQKAEQDAIQAKYEYLMRIKILQFYNGIAM